MERNNTKITKEQFLDLVEEYIYRRSVYSDYVGRSDHIRWSEEDELQAWKNYHEAEDKMLSIVFPEEEDDS